MPTIEITQEQIKSLLAAAVQVLHYRCSDLETLFDVVATTSPESINGLDAEIKDILNLPDSKVSLMDAHNAIESLSIAQEPLHISAQLSDVEVVFDHWVRVMGKSPMRTKLTKKRKSKIQLCLKEGYSVQDMIEAIDGCAKSRYHMGDNANGTLYNDIELILRDGTNLEKFRDTIGVVNGPLISNGAPVGNRSSKEIGAMEIAIDRSWAD